LKCTAEVAALLGMHPATFRAHMQSGAVKPPRCRVGMRFFWTDAEVAAARAALAVPGRRRPKRACKCVQMNKRVKITKATDLPPKTLERMLSETEEALGPETPSAQAIRRALAKARRRAERRQEAAALGTKDKNTEGPS